MSEHTPGPWESHHQKMDSIDYEWSLQTMDHAFLLFNFSPTLSPVECRGNASLIAAAPDLLYALRRILATINPGNVDSHSKDCGCVIHEARAAVTKAEGQNNLPHNKTRSEHSGTSA